MSRMAADIQRVLLKELDYLMGSSLMDRVDDHLEKAMMNYEELRQVEKDHAEIMDKFIKSVREARTQLDQGTDQSLRPELLPKARTKGRSTYFNNPGRLSRTKPP